MAKRVVDESSLTSVADAIRSKKGTTAPLVFPEGFRNAIESIKAGDPKLHSKAVTPSADNQTVFPDADYDGLSHVTVAGDPDLVSGNIKEGVNIFGVTGTHTGIGGTVADTSDATATEDDIEKGKTAYVNGKKITGKHECEEGLDTSDATATENDLLKGATAYVNGEKITGMHECDVFTLPALTAPGSANDLVSGKQLIDASGNVVTGELLEKASFYKTGAAVSYEPAIKDFTLQTKTDSDMVLRAGKYITLYADGSNFGDAAAADVAKGKTFTSQNGLKVVGTHECDGGVTLPTLTNPASASDMAYGKKLIDSSGNVVTGTLMESKPDDGTMGFAGTQNPEVFVNTPGNIPTLNISAEVGMDKIVRTGARVCARAALTEFGDATAADVAAGKTFTSAAGHKVVGTMDVDALINNALEVIENGTY